MILCNYKKCMVVFHFSVLFVSLFLDINGLPRKGESRNKSRSSNSRSQEAGSSSTASGSLTSIPAPSIATHGSERSSARSAHSKTQISGGPPKIDDIKPGETPSGEPVVLGRNARRMMWRRRAKEAEMTGEGESRPNTSDGQPEQSEPEMFELTAGETTILIPLFVKFEVLKDNPDAFFESENVVRMPEGELFVVCDSKEAADDFREAVLEYHELYADPTSFSSHITIIRNIPKDMTDGEIGLIMFENYFEFPSKIQFVSIKSTREQQLKMATLQVSDPLLEKIKSSPDKNILVRGIPHKIDLCLIIDRRDEEEDTVSTYNSHEYPAPAGHHQNLYVEGTTTDLSHVDATLNLQSHYKSFMEKWKARVAIYSNMKEVFDNELLVTELNKDKCLIILPKIHQALDVFIELKNLVTDPSEFGVQSTTLFASNTVMVYCNSKEETYELWKVIDKSPKLHVTLLGSISYEILVHDLPEDITDQEIIHIICETYNEAPESVYFLNYKEKIGVRLARLIVNESLLKKMSFTPTLIVLRYGMVIHSHIQMQQCVNCGLLGHRINICPLLPRLPAGAT